MDHGDADRSAGGALRPAHAGPADPAAQHLAGAAGTGGGVGHLHGGVPLPTAPLAVPLGARRQL